MQDFLDTMLRKPRRLSWYDKLSKTQAKGRNASEVCWGPVLMYSLSCASVFPVL